MVDHVIRSPILIFELRHGSADESLVRLSQLNLAKLTKDESEDAYLRVRRAAESGSAFAMCLCAMWPDVRRRGTPTDDERRTWAESAARSNYPPGLFELGQCFEKAIGVPVDLTRACELYERSSKGGFGFASHRLGMAFFEGQFGAIDVGRAVRFMELAYQQGESLGAHDLGQWFEEGIRVPRDLSAAVAWYQRASEAGNFFATHRLQVAYMMGELGLRRDASMAKQYEARLFEQTETGAGNSAEPLQSDDVPPPKT